MTATSVSGYTDSRGRRVSAYTQDRQAGAYQPRHASTAKTALTIGGGALILMAVIFRVIWTTLNVWVALMVLVTVTLLGLAGWVGARKVRSTRRKAVHHAQRSVGRRGRNGGRRSGSPAVIEARANAKKILRDQRHQFRNERRERRNAAMKQGAVAVGRGARVGVAKVRAGWSQ